MSDKNTVISGKGLDVEFQSAIALIQPIEKALNEGADADGLAKGWTAFMEIFSDISDEAMRQRVLEALTSRVWPTLKNREFTGREELKTMMQSYEIARPKEWIELEPAMERVVMDTRANTKATLATTASASSKATLMSAPGAELLQKLKATAPEQATEEPNEMVIEVAGKEFVFLEDKKALDKALKTLDELLRYAKTKKLSPADETTIVEISEVLVDLFGQNEALDKVLDALQKVEYEEPQATSAVKRRPASKAGETAAPVAPKEKSPEEILAELSNIELTPKSFKRIQRAFNKYPNNFDICHLYALAAEKIGDYERAMRGLNAALRVVPDEKAEQVMRDKDRVEKLLNPPAPQPTKAPAKAPKAAPTKSRSPETIVNELRLLAKSNPELAVTLDYFETLNSLNQMSLRRMAEETEWTEYFCKRFKGWLQSEPVNSEAVLSKIGLKKSTEEIAQALIAKRNIELDGMEKAKLNIRFDAYFASLHENPAPAPRSSAAPKSAPASAPVTAPKAPAVAPKQKQTIDIAKDAPVKLREIVDRLTENDLELRKKFNYVWQKAQESKEGYKDAALDTAVSMIRTLAKAAKSDNEDVLEHMEKSVELALKYCQKVDINQKAKTKLPPPPSGGPTLRGGVSGAAKATAAAEPSAPEPVAPAPARAPRLRLGEEREAPAEAVSMNVADVMESILPREVKFSPEGNPPDPASVAIVELINRKIGTDAAKMEALKKYLEDPEDFLNDQIRSLRDDTSISTAKLGRMPANLEKDIRLLISKRTDMSRQGRSDEIIKISQEIEAAEKLREAATVAYKLRTQGSPFKSTGHVLAAINTHFNDSGESLSVILNRTNEQIEKAREGSYTTLNRLANAVTLGLINPTLNTTLKKLVKEDEVLKAVGAEKMLRLSAVYNDKNGVRSWVRSLNNADKIVPLLIGYLDLAVRNGNISHLNIVSLKSARILTGHLRSAMYTDFVDTAKKVKGEDIDRMNAYFAQMEDFNKKQLDVTRKYITSPTVGRAVSVSGAALLGGLGVGLATAGFAAPVLATGAGMASATALLGSNRVESPTGKKVLEQIALRGSLASGLALGGMGLLTAASGGTLAMIAVPGLFAPEIWKNKGKIGRAAWFVLPKPWRWLGGRW